VRLSRFDDRAEPCERPVEIHHLLRENHHWPHAFDTHPAAPIYSITLIIKILLCNVDVDENLATAMHSL
jgi:hypothetical protein